MSGFKKIMLISLLVLSVLIIGCTSVQQETGTTPELVQETAEGVQVEETLQKTACEFNTDCEQNLLCIDGKCQTLASLYKTDCENKCTITKVKVKTSDGEDYELSLGQGSYTAAGALEWKLLKTPDYCPGADPLVAINIIKKTTGKVVGEQVLTLHKGDTSDEITHPTVKSVKFTASLTDVTEVCS